MGKRFLLWIPMVPIAMANGVLRQLGYGKYMSELRAHQLSTLTGVILFGLYTGAVVRAWSPGSSTQALSIGLIWLGLTVTFEFLLGHYVAGQSWGRLLRDYDLFAGRLWVVILIWVAIAPYVFFRLQRQASGNPQKKE